MAGLIKEGSWHSLRSQQTTTSRPSGTLPRDTANPKGNFLNQCSPSISKAPGTVNAKTGETCPCPPGSLSDGQRAAQATRAHGSRRRQSPSLHFQGQLSLESSMRAKYRSTAKMTWG